jgi:hypothetical protein
MNAHRAADVQIHIFLSSALVGGEWSASCPVRFTPEERASDAHWIGGWVDPQSRSGLCGGDKILDPTGTPNSDPLVVQPVASCYTDVIPVLYIN